MTDDDQDSRPYTAFSNADEKTQDQKLGSCLHKPEAGTNNTPGKNGNSYELFGIARFSNMSARYLENHIADKENTCCQAG